MSSLTYKNILAVGRDCKNKSVIQLLRDGYQFWFPEQRPPFSYASPNDKVIVFYPQSSIMSDTITHLKDEDIFSRDELPIGALKFMSDGSMIKIVECKFCTAESFKDCLVLLREYLLETIRKLNLPDYNSVNFVIFWDEKLLNPLVTDAIKQAGLLTNDNELAHVFSVSEIQGGPAPKSTPELKFGPSPQPYNLQNPFAPVLNSSTDSSQQPSGLNQQQPTTTFGFNQQPTTTFGFNQQQQPTTTFGFNQQQSTAGQQPTTTFGFNQQQQPTTTFGFNQQASTTPRTSFFTTPQSGFPNPKQNFFTQPKTGFNWGLNC